MKKTDDNADKNNEMILRKSCVKLTKRPCGRKAGDISSMSRIEMTYGFMPNLAIGIDRVHINADDIIRILADNISIWNLTGKMPLMNNHSSQQKIPECDTTRKSFTFSFMSSLPRTSRETRKRAETMYIKRTHRQNP
ncbi:hypothetical protein JW968_02540 [Candidatus Woesearchaeota archaeon]|nr:hypothetical protein [Candidatus Woesearchaeota archaeon]